MRHLTLVHTANNVDLTGLVSGLPLGTKLMILASFAIPYITAWLTDHPSHLTGVLTAVVAGVGGVITSVANSDDVTWQALGIGLVSWLLAGGWHAFVSKDYEEAVVHGKGLTLGKRSTAKHERRAA